MRIAGAGLGSPPLLLLLLILSCVATVTPLRLTAYISSGGLHGEVRFEPGSSGPDSVHLRVSLKPTFQYPIQLWSWALTEFPVDYRRIGEDRCDERLLGRSLVDLTDVVGPLVFPGNETVSLDVAQGLALTGERGLAGKGLLMRDQQNDRTICASISVHDRRSERTAEARFQGAVQGSVWFRWFGSRSPRGIADALVQADLRHTEPAAAENFTEHRWKIFVTDVYDGFQEQQNNCNVLQTLFDPDNSGPGKAIGDVDGRVGKLRVAAARSDRPSAKRAYRDPRLELLPYDLLLGAHRALYLVIFHPSHEDVILTCARIKPRRPIVAKAIINSRGLRGEVTLTQDTPFTHTWVNVSLAPINDLIVRYNYNYHVASYRVHELPRELEKFLGDQDEEPCATTKRMYDPLRLENSGQPSHLKPPPGLGSQDQYAVGDLSGKLQDRKEGSLHLDIEHGSAKLAGIYWDAYLPLSGLHSVAHRSLVVHRHRSDDDPTPVPWVCGTLALQAADGSGRLAMTTARAIFRYPLVGQIVIRQPQNDPDADATIIVEHLVHADGSTLNDTHEHRWMIHANAPGKDYYNWTARCLSAGDPYNPWKIKWDNNDSSSQQQQQQRRCGPEDATFCRVGDLEKRHGWLDIAGQKANALALTRRLFTDPLVALSGPASIFGKSIVIYDDHGPKARGERLACSIISGMNRRKAVARDWFGNGEESKIDGKLEFIQESPYDVTDVEVHLEGLETKMSGYHVHMTPVEIDLEFPCDDTTLYGHWNPLGVDPNSAPPPTTGSSDQYELGDLSGKFGTLDGRKLYDSVYNDTQLPLFGPRSIIGRSVVVHKKEKNARWACTTIERGYSPSEAREIRAIASFHHPNGFAYGYIRMTQLIYKDGSQSDTVIEVNLRHPGKYNTNVTRNHNWAIYVNPVGVDATVKVRNTRCVAGGYRWNPYFTQLADPLNEDLYRQECGRDLPLRCHVGDVSARVGPIDIDQRRQVLVDPNFPLEGAVTAMGKSIVILEPDFGHYPFACANIEPDNDIIKYVNIRKPPRFVAAQFLEEVQEVLGVPEWMLSLDNRKTKVLHNGDCIQFLMHFKGPIVAKLEQDFNRLLMTGKQAEPSLAIPGYVPNKRKTTLGYRLCEAWQSQKNKERTFKFYYGAGSNLTPSLMMTWLISVSLVLRALLL
ncbi:uncharacterized protein LOC106658129 [Trichogramma pretiosum]|uniref:uncharacterized protein LOC106658129 n=1 Tax=Trichogramma pretiosum TaxID=7493 RepID=UPI0006C975DC|nr:uncharacterized protein LOC106658129 [Trichogramma pretiosum]